MSAKLTLPYVAWVDHGNDGWMPVEFDTEAALRDWILSSQSFGSDFVVTRLLDVRITLDERTPS